MTCYRPMLAHLQKRGVRVTAQRALILEDLYHNPGHRTAEEIYQRVYQQLPGLNRATVYRTLELLRSARVVTAFTGLDGVTEFELLPHDGEQPHHHLQCSRCGLELHLDAELVGGLRAQIEQRYGFQADLDHLHILGLCPACAARAEPAETTFRR